MSQADFGVQPPPQTGWPAAQRLAGALRSVGPPLLFGLRLWASVCLALYVAFWLELDNAFWAGTSAAIVCQPHLGASLRKGWFRMIGTLDRRCGDRGADRMLPAGPRLFLVALALWGAACAFVATLLRNFASYAAALAGYTAAIIAADELGATGGPNADAVFMLAVTRASEICIGIVCAGVVLAGDRFRRRPAPAGRVVRGPVGRNHGPVYRHFGAGGAGSAGHATVRRELVRRVVALDPVIDEANGESSQLRYHSPVLQRAVDGLFAALAGWRTMAVLLARLPDDQARQEADAVLRSIPKELRAARSKACRRAGWPIPSDRAGPAGGGAGAERFAGRHAIAAAACRPDGRVLAGISHALNGLACLSEILRVPFLAAMASGSACPIGCLLSSMRGARSSRSAWLRFSGS